MKDLLAILALSLILPANGLKISNVDSADRIEDQYLILLDRQALRHRLSKNEELRNTFTRLQALNITVLRGHVFDRRAVIAIQCPEALAQRVELPGLELIEANTRFLAFENCTSEQVPDITWGLQRINSREKPLYTNATYNYTSGDGEDTYVYIIDSGIYTQHRDFEGRAVHGFTASAIKQQEGDEDLNGHGTHCTGIAIGRTYGVAKSANAIAVKVLNKEGTGSVMDFVDGCEWTLADYQSKSKLGPYMAVASMSLGVASSKVVDGVVEDLIDAGLPVVVAAGNSDADACDFSPARVSGAITVGASTLADKMASFSNHGSCLDVIAPGVAIISTYIGDPDATKILGGTSMAAPHVSGALLRVMSQLGGPEAPMGLHNWVVGFATVDKLEMEDSNTPNRLLYAPCNLTSEYEDLKSNAPLYLPQCILILITCAIANIF